MFMKLYMYGIHMSDGFILVNNVLQLCQHYENKVSIHVISLTFIGTY